MRKRLISSIVVLVGLSSLSFGYNFNILAPPDVFDPNGTGTVSAHWSLGNGLPDSDSQYLAGTFGYALRLRKTSSTETNASALVRLRGVTLIHLREIGFDVRADSRITAGSPRFDVFTVDTDVNGQTTYTDHFLGAGNGPQTLFNPTSGKPWKRVLWTETDLADPTKTFPPIAPGAVIGSITLIYDEGPDGAGQDSALVDNINVNGTIIRRP